MKLNKDNFNKTIEGDLTIYKYNCNDTNFFLELVGNNENRNINVFKGSLDDRQELKTTKDTLEAWNYFETLLVECQSKQGSSGGGGMKNPQDNPNVLPLMAIGSVDKDGFRNNSLFLLMDDKSQVKVFDFKVSVDTMPQPLPDGVFEVDWSGEDIPNILKSEVLLKRFEDVKFDEAPDKKVFLFIPKSLMSQGGEEGGNTEEGEKGEKGEPSDEKGEPTDEMGEPTDEKGEPTDEKGEPSDEKGEPNDKKGQPNDEMGEPTDEKGEPSDEKGEPTDEKGEIEEKEGAVGQMEKMNFSDTIQNLSKSTDGEYPPSELIGLFRSVGTGEVWLSQNNFPKIKKDLGLPINMTPRQLSEIIINSK